MQIQFFNKSVPVLLAGLLLTGCAGSLPPPKPEMFNFDQAAKDPRDAIKQNLKIEIFGDGTKGTKKFVIGAFQVRFRNDLTGAYHSDGAHITDPYYLSGSNSALFQKVTDDLYKKFVAELKQRGIQTVGLSAIRQQPEFQKYLKQEKSSGFSEKFTAGAISCDLCDDVPPGDIAGVMTALSPNVSATEYDVFTPSEVPAVEYSLMGPNFGMVVLPRIAPIPWIDASAKAGAGLINVGFEVELMKFDREDRGRSIAMSHAPMLRTKLIAFNAFPAGAKFSFNLWGRPIDDGLVISPKYRGKKHTNLFAAALNGTAFNKQWVEIDDGSVTVDVLGAVTPVADKFPATFKKSTEPQLQMMMYVLDHQADYK
jgi:hypothetical protein